MVSTRAFSVTRHSLKLCGGPPHAQALGIETERFDESELEGQALLQVHRLRGGMACEDFPSRPEACDVTFICTVARSGMPLASRGRLGGPAATSAETRCMATTRNAQKRERSFSASSSVSTATTVPSTDVDEDEDTADSEGDEARVATAVMEAIERTSKAKGDAAVGTRLGQAEGSRHASEEKLPLSCAALLAPPRLHSGGASRGSVKRKSGEEEKKETKRGSFSASEDGAPMKGRQVEREEAGWGGSNERSPVSAPPSSRMRKYQASDSTSGPSVRVLYANSVVLAEKSAYFQRAFRGGGFRETGEREVKLDFQDEEGFEDFARLIRLCHGPSFTSEVSHASVGLGPGPAGGEKGGPCRRPLGGKELLGLALVSDAFEVVACLEDCVAALCDSMSYSLAVETFKRVPEGLSEHEHIRRVLEAASAALARWMGVMDSGVWSRRRPDVSRGWKDKYVRYLPDLQPCMQRLPLMAIDFLLRSPALRLRSENDAFAFLCAWLKGREGWSKGQAQRAFNRLIGNLRWHAMTSDFLATVVSQSKLMCQSGRLLEVLRSALCFRDSGSHIRRYVVHHAVQQYVEEQQAQQEQLLEPGSISQAGAEDMETEGMRGAKRAALQAYESRAEDDEDELYVLKGTFSLAKCLALPPGKFIRRYLGVVQGLPCFLDLERSLLEGASMGTDGGRAAGGREGPVPPRRETLGLFLGICNSGNERGLSEGGAGAGSSSCASKSGGRSRLSPAVVPLGCLVRYDITVGSCTRGPSIDIFANAKQPWGYRDVLSKEWGEVVRESSPHFDRRGRMEVVARLRFLRDGRVLPFFEDGQEEEDEESSDDEEEGHFEEDISEDGGEETEGGEEEEEDSDQEEEAFMGVILEGGGLSETTSGDGIVAESGVEISPKGGSRLSLPWSLGAWDDSNQTSSET